MTAQEVLNKAINGDIILYKGRGLISGLIRYFDNAQFTHVGVVWHPERTSHKLTLDMWTTGLTCLPLKRRVSIYDEFCIIRPNKPTFVLDSVINDLLYEWDGSNIKYDYMLLLRIAIYKKLKLSPSMGRGKRFICSEFAQRYAEMIGLTSYLNNKLITPQDFLRMINTKECQIII